MSLKAEDVVKALDIDLKKYDEAPEAVKSFVEDFGKEWKRAKDMPDVDAAKGKWNNVLRGGIKKLNKEYELGLEVKDDGDPVDYLPEIAKILQGKSASQIADLTEKLKKNAPEAVEAQWSEKYGKLEKKHKETEALLSGMTGKYEALEKSIADRDARAWEDNEWAKAEGKIQWKQDISDYEKKGFLADQRARYKAQKDEKGSPFATDAEGNRISDPTKPSRFKELDEILTENAKTAKLWKVHEKGGQRVNPVRLSIEDIGRGPQGDKPVRKLHPALAR